MATVPKLVAPPNRYDPQGCLLPFTKEEKSQYVAAILEGLASMAAIPDDPNEDDRDFFRAFDESHPGRPMFTGLY